MFDLVIVGAGGFGREVLQYAQDAIAAGMLDARIKGFLDDDKTQADLAPFGVDARLLGTIDAATPEPNERYVIALGEPAARATLHDSLSAAGASFATLVHPTAYVAPSAGVAGGAIICPFAFVAVNACLEKNVVLNTYASAGHDCRIGAHTVLSPYAAVNGWSVLGEQVIMGTSAIITPRTTVHRRAKISAGSVVYHDVPEGALALGNPARARVVG